MLLTHICTYICHNYYPNIFWKNVSHFFFNNNDRIPIITTSVCIFIAWKLEKKKSGIDNQVLYLNSLHLICICFIYQKYPNNLEYYKTKCLPSMKTVICFAMYNKYESKELLNKIQKLIHIKKQLK